MFYLMMNSTHFIYGYMVSDALPPHGLLFPISSKIPDRIAHTIFVTPVVEHRLEQEIAESTTQGCVIKLIRVYSRRLCDKAHYSLQQKAV